MAPPTYNVFAGLGLASYNASPHFYPFSQAKFAQAAAASQSTISFAAGGAGIYNVCTGFMASLCVTTVLASGETGVLNLRDGASGAGTVLWTCEIGLPGTAAVGTTQIVGPISGLFLIGSANTAMTLEFSAGLTGVVESVSLAAFYVQ